MGGYPRIPPHRKEDELGLIVKAGGALSDLLRRANIGLALVGVFCLFLMMLLVSADVIARYVAKPIPGTLEITEFLMAFLIFFSLAYTMAKGGHVRVTVLTGRFSPRWQAICEYLALVLGLLVMALVTWASFKYFWGAYQAGAIAMGLIDIPTWPFLATVPIGAAFFSLEVLRQIVGRLSQSFRSEAATASSAEPHAEGPGGAAEVGT